MKLGFLLTLVACIMITLSACSSGAQLNATPNLGSMRAITNNIISIPATSKLIGEDFSADVVHLHGCTSQEPAEVDFSATGTTAGPYPGAFKSHGSWRWGGFGHNHGWFFYQSFTVNSGSTTIHGNIHGSGRYAYNGPASCTRFDAGNFFDPLNYRAKGFGKGSAKADIYQGYLSESLQ
jgi:hypothetical protein